MTRSSKRKATETQAEQNRQLRPASIAHGEAHPEHEGLPRDGDSESFLSLNTIRTLLR